MGGHVHDRPTTAREHGGDLELHREEQAPEIDGDGPIEILHREVGKGGGLMAGAGVVECEVDPPEPAQGLVHEPLEASSIGGVRRHGERFRPRLSNAPCDLLERMGVAGREDDRCSSARERVGGGRADPAARTEDESHLAAESGSRRPRRHGVSRDTAGCLQHLKVLKEAGLVLDRADGTRRLYRANPAALEALRSYLDRFWDRALFAFKKAAEREAQLQQAGDRERKERSR